MMTGEILHRGRHGGDMKGGGERYEDGGGLCCVCVCVCMHICSVAWRDRERAERTSRDYTFSNTPIQEKHK